MIEPLLLVNILTFIFVTLSLILFRQRGLFNEYVKTEDRKIHLHRSFKPGGIAFICLLVILLFIDDTIMRMSLLVSCLFLLIGLISDINDKFTSSLRIILMFSITTLFIFFYEINITKLNIPFINYLLNSYIFLSIIVTSVCLVVLINGFNFIDGNHGLSTGTGIIILLLLIFRMNEHSDYIINSVGVIDVMLSMYALLCATIILFLFNFLTGRIFCGDSGSYFLGSLIGLIAILLNIRGMIAPFEIACYLFYPAAEVIFSFIRRTIFYNQNPFKADNLHLHSLIFTILKQKLSVNDKLNIENINRLTSLIILLFVSLLLIFVYKYGELIGYKNCTYFLLTTYAFFYVYVFRLYRKLTK